VDSTLGIENLDANTVRIFPNPFKNSITIKTPTQNNYGVEVFDVSGRVILNQKYSTGNGTINLNLGTLSQGAYFIKV
ncbi:MAG: T9SS type A sorting domain-containing protein, partial [Flavobacteriaceae bacterium]|nr:T9SS type A sorting domain-containing protein [Flavobacteriaceae bacterium]